MPRRLADPLDRALWRALHAYGPEMRYWWRLHRRLGADDARMAWLVAGAFACGGFGGHYRRGYVAQAYPAGGVPGPALWLGVGPARRKEVPADLEGGALVARARALLRIPYPREDSTHDRF